MSELKKWQTLNSTMVLNHRWCQIRQDEIKLPNGQIIDDFFVTIKPDIAMVLAITNSKEIILVRQYRHAVGDFFLELPAGLFEPTLENAEAAAIRELKEETGYTAEKVIKIATLYDKPSKDTNKTHLFVAENVIKTDEQNLDVTEEIEIVLIPIDSILDQVIQGEIAVTGSISALFLGLNFIQTNNIRQA